MTIKNFIPAIWDARIQTEFRAQSVAAGLTNREYQGQAARGNTVKIFGINPVAIHDYKAQNRTTTPDPVTMWQDEFVIDQEKVFDFLIDDIDEAQAAGPVEGAYVSSAAAGLVEDADKWLWTKIVGEAGANVNAAVPAVDTAAQVYDVFKAARRELNRKNVPDAGRVAIINSDLEDPLLDYDSKFTEADKIGTNRAVLEATIGRLLGFNIIRTDHLPGNLTDQAQAVFGHINSMAFVDQIQKSEAMRAENSFSDRLRGLHVYGGGVTRPDGLVTYTGPAAV